MAEPSFINVGRPDADKSLRLRQEVKYLKDRETEVEWIKIEVAE
jgi:hypothetical protein